MALQVRRVITGHDASGQAIVHIDELCKNTFVGRPGATSINVWTTEGFPANNDGTDDAGLRKVGTTIPNGTIFRILEFAPGVARAPTARTRSTTSSWCPARSTWSWTTRWCISKPATSWFSGEPSTTR